MCGMWHFKNFFKTKRNPPLVRLNAMVFSFPSLSNFSSSPSAPGPSSTGDLKVQMEMKANLKQSRYLICQIRPHISFHQGVHELLCPESTFSEASSPSFLLSSSLPSGCSMVSGRSTPLGSYIGQSHYHHNNHCNLPVLYLIYVQYPIIWEFVSPRLMEQRRKLQYTDLVRYASSFLDRCSSWWWWWWWWC